MKKYFILVLFFSSCTTKTVSSLERQTSSDTDVHEAVGQIQKLKGIQFNSETVSPEDQKRILQQIKNQLKSTDPGQLRDTQSILNSNLLISIEEVPGSGITDLIDPVATQEKINAAEMDIVEALGQIKIIIHPGTMATDKGIEGTLVHEGRHAMHFARVISNFSYGKNDFDPNLYSTEYAAHVTSAKYPVYSNTPHRQELLKEAVELKLLSKTRKGYKVDTVGIRERLSRNYDLADHPSRLGWVFSEKYNLKPAQRTQSID